MSFYDTVKNMPPITKGTLVNELEGVVTFEKNGIFSYLEIHYEGYARIISALPPSYYIVASSNKIVIFLFGDEDCGETLFRYSGALRIIKARARNIDGAWLKIFTKEFGNLEINNSETVFNENETSKWEDYIGDEKEIKIKQSKVIQSGTLLQKEAPFASYQKHGKKKAGLRFLKPSRKNMIEIIKERKEIVKQKLIKRTRK